MLCGKFPQVEDIYLSEVVHIVKTVVIVSLVNSN